MDPATNEDDDVTNSCQGKVSFALARLYHVLVDKNSHNLVQKKEEWLLEGARRAAAYIVASNSDMTDEDVPIMDEWVMSAIGELYRYSILGGNIGTAMIDHAMRIVQLAANSQTTYIGHGEDMDKLSNLQWRFVGHCYIQSSGRSMCCLQFGIEYETGR